jgi:hypothetical protein
MTNQARWSAAVARWFNVGSVTDVIANVIAFTIAGILASRFGFWVAVVTWVAMNCFWLLARRRKRHPAAESIEHQRLRPFSNFGGFPLTYWDRLVLGATLALFVFTIVLMAVGVR